MIAAGCSVADISGFLLDGDGRKLAENAWVSPVSLTWAMGFAHSAFVAQQVMTATCLDAGFHESQFLTNAGSLPPLAVPSIAVATDDVNVFTRLSRDERRAVTVPPPQALDKVWIDWGLVPKPGSIFFGTRAFRIRETRIGVTWRSGPGRRGK